MLARRLVAGLARIRARSAARSSSSWTDRVLAHPAAAARLARAEERLRVLDEELAAGGGAAAAAREHAALSELQGAARANDSADPAHSAPPERRSLAPSSAPSVAAAGCVLDARAGVGGVEAAHFLGQLGRCWRLYSERRGWRFEQLRVTRTEQGDPSEFIASVSGDGAYAALRHEAGVHRVQRVPAAQRSSANAKKMQTSAVLCAVLPEAREGDEHADIPAADLRVETKRSSGAGGQHVNTTDSAVRVTHTPTGISVSIQDERSQHRNRDKAMRVLRARLADRRRREESASRLDAYDEQSGGNFLFGGDRRVRTYHFPQNRCTDHRLSGAAAHADLTRLIEEAAGLEEFHQELDMDEALRSLEEQERAVAGQAGSSESSSAEGSAKRGRRERQRGQQSGR
eukprot:PRCOL_00006991-RA